MQNTIKINPAPFLSRFYTYQKERFPILAHGALIAVFTFSAIAYSRICRGEDGFIPLGTYLIGIFSTITLFFLVRVFDEFKDKEDDAKYRKYLPVPRGLISLNELKYIGAVVVTVQIIVIAVFHPRMLPLYFLAIGYLCLMGVEFFVPAWLKKRQLLYVTSHMFIIPLVDIYASGLDWMLEDGKAPFGLLFFFAVSYMNGIVLEFGRKIRAPEKEEEGVVSYTKLYGTKKGTIYWILILGATLILAFIASWHAVHPVYVFIFLTALFILCAMPALLFLKNQTEKLSKMIEYASGVWTLGMYLSLGGLPMVSELLG